jgi:hypothetical protein
MNSYVFEVRASRRPRIRHRPGPSTALVLATFVLFVLFVLAAA